LVLLVLLFDDLIVLSSNIRRVESILCLLEGLLLLLDGLLIDEHLLLPLEHLVNCRLGLLTGQSLLVLLLVLLSFFGETVLLFLNILTNFSDVFLGPLDGGFIREVVDSGLAVLASSINEVFAYFKNSWQLDALRIHLLL